MLDTILGLNWVVIFGLLWAISEVLALIPSVQANSVFQLIVGVLKTVKDKFFAPKV